MASMFTNCFGVLFSGFLLELRTSSTKVSEIFNVALALSSFFSFLAEPLVNQFGWRKVTFTTSLVYAAGLASSALSASASYFFISTMMITGVSQYRKHYVIGNVWISPFMRLILKKKLESSLTLHFSCRENVSVVSFMRLILKEKLESSLTLCFSCRNVHLPAWGRRATHRVVIFHAAAAPCIMHRDSGLMRQPGADDAVHHLSTGRV